MITRSFTGQRFEVRVDGANGGAFTATVSGGGANGQVVTENAGVSSVQLKHLGGIKVEPLKLDVALASAKPLLAWMRSSWRGENPMRSGSLVIADERFNEHTEQWFTNAMITECAFPELDRNTFRTPSLSVTVMPQETGMRPAGGGTLKVSDQPPDMTDWSTSNFLFELDGFAHSTRTFKVSQFAIKQEVEQFNSGEMRFGELCTTGLTCDDLTIYIPIAFGQKFQEWYDRVIQKGSKDTSEQHTGALTFLSHGGKPLLEVELNGVGIHDCRQENVKTGNGTVAAYKVVLHVERYNF